MKWKTILTFTYCTLIFIVVEFFAQKIFLQIWSWERFFRFSAIACIVLAILLRIFNLISVTNHRANSEISSKLEALQSKMAPHFLFNCLNTIAELGHINPNKSEEAIQNLSTLLRNSLSSNQHLHSILEEISLCKKYVELEQLRLGERLKVIWKIDDASLQQSNVPKLLLQPLIENAVIHGVSKQSSLGVVTVSALQLGSRIKILVENSFNSDQRAISEKSILESKKGLGIALPNIKERLFVIYDDKYKFATKQSIDTFSVAIEIPSSPSQVWLNQN